MRVAKETHKFLIGGVCAENAKKMKFFFSPYLTEEYPIWWGNAPHIMNVFMESYDFSGKTIVPFCTSGSSGIGSSAKNLHDYTDSSVTWLDGERFSGNSSKEDMAEWIRGLSLGIEVK